MLKKLITFSLMLLVMVSFAQKGKPQPKPKEKYDPTKTSETVKAAPPDSLMGYALYEGMTPFASLEYQLAHESETDPVTGKTTYFKDIKKRNDSIRVAFRGALKKRYSTFNVRTVKPRSASERMKLCINIVAKDTNLTHCFKDSIMRDPEVSKVLYDKAVGDTVYMLILVEAFNKTINTCGTTKESKLYFARWNYKESKAIWKVKTFSSCAKTITNMTKTPVIEWDKKSPLVISFNKGSDFVDLTFDPEKPEKGIVSSNDGFKE